MVQNPEYEEIEIYRNIISSTSDGIAFLDRHYRYVVVNETYERFSGISRDRLIGLTVSEYLGRETFEQVVKEQFDRCLRGEAITYQAWFEFPQLGKRYMDVSYSPYRDKKKRIQGVIANTRDITAWHDSAAEQRITFRLLEALHEHKDIRALARKAVELIRDWSGCEAVGIRLQQGEDFPYYETRGFPASFIARESRLCGVDDQGELRRAQNGNAELDCLCGHVIRGRMIPDLSFFTEKGSFWTNSTTELLNSLQSGQKCSNLRGHCHREGYESVALIPLQDSNTTIGLLQINDRRRDRFDTNSIAVYERLASLLTPGFLERNTALLLKEKEQQYKALIDNLPGTAYQFKLTAAGKQSFTFIGGGCEELFGLSAAEIMADPAALFALLPAEDAILVQEEIALSAKTLDRYDVEHRIQARNREEQWVRTISTPRKLPTGEILWDGIAINITSRKNTEQKLLQSYRDIEIRVRVARLFLTAPAETLFNQVLEILLERFDAAFGYIGYVDVNGDLVCPSMSREVWQECRVPEKSIVFPRQQWGGMWGESLLKKISLRRNGKLKTPSGHVAMTNALIVPIVADEEVVGQIALADTPAGFTAAIQAQLESLAEFIGPVLQMYLEKERMHSDLRSSVHKLKQTNIALNVMVDNRRDERSELSRRIQQNFDKLVFPYFETLSQSHSRKDIMTIMEIIRENVRISLQGLKRQMSFNQMNFSPREVQVAQLIVQGKTSKEIGAILRISSRSVFFHRNNIRQKLGIHKAKTNLRTSLQKIQSR